MKVFSSYNEIPGDWDPLVLTIGKFDSVHLGHRSLLEQARKVANQMQGYLCVVTFANHPIGILKEGVLIPKLCTQAHQLKLMSESGVDGVLLLEFTKQFSQQTAEEFIKSIYRHRPFKALVLGYDARLGRDRQGNTPIMHDLAEKYGFELQYSAPWKSENIIISSSLIRNAITSGDWSTVEKMLGRKYSILAFAAEETANKITFANLTDLCLPPPGSYHVTVLCEEGEFTAHAVIKKEPPVLTVEFDEKKYIVGDRALEVTFNV